MSESQLPNLLNVVDIKNILKISYNEADRIFELQSLPVIIIGNKQRVLRKDFFRWLELADLKNIN